MMCWHRWKWGVVEVRHVKVRPYIGSGVYSSEDYDETQHRQQATCQKCGKVKERRVS